MKAVPVKQIHQARKRTGGASRKGGVLNPTAVKRIQRRYQVMHMRTLGHTYTEIAEALKIAPELAREDVQTLMKDTVLKNQEDTDELRQIQSDRLDGLLKAYYPLATQETQRVHTNRKTGEQTVVTEPPDPEFASIILRLEDQRAKLMGTNRPDLKNIEVTGVREYIGVDMDKV